MLALQFGGDIASRHFGHVVVDNGGDGRVSI
jgi:hypothetical protein